VCIPEINSLRNALRTLKIPSKLTYVLLNKKTNLKLYLIENNKSFNPLPGTVVDTKVTSGEYNDFYMISAKSNQGLPSTIHYQVIYDDKNVPESDFQLLMYKLSYLYYNWTGSIKVPAPCQYAKKLATLLGDKLSDKRNVFLPNSRFSQQLKSLYYL
jgi:aubergine-like protein